jgi:pyridoxamine 5'-phosphate oxidase
MNRDQGLEGVSGLRQSYGRGFLEEGEAPEEPLGLFAAWFEEARGAGLREPNAMTLATVRGDGRPAARTVLLKEADARGFVFYTNYQSAKGGELEGSGWAALLFWWDVLERQVRVEGRVERVSGEESDAYFAGRPRGSQLGAWVSPQSEAIEDRGVLEERLAYFEAAFSGRGVPRPPHWGGYRVVAEEVEFWQGRADRLHDRLRYRRSGEGWSRARLAP